jgi:pyrroloquinoline-quinone synthase
MTPHESLAALDRLIQSRSILGHPFYVAWRNGTLTREQLAAYARVYYPHVAAFPGYLRAAIAGADDPVVRAELGRNLVDEVSCPRPHPDLWLDFAQGVGADRGAVERAEPHPAARRAIDTFERLARSETAVALAALYAYESQQPEVARQKADGLRTRYGVTARDTLAYFEVHAVADVAHREGERDGLRRALTAGASAEDVQRGAGEALDAYWQLLDGVCDAADVPLPA